MNTNEFRRHLASIHNVLNSNQRSLYEGKEEEVEVEVEVEESTEIDTQELKEALVVSFLESYFGGELNEDTDDDDITNAIMELNATCNAVNEYFGVTNEVAPLVMPVLKGAAMIGGEMMVNKAMSKKKGNDGAPPV